MHLNTISPIIWCIRFALLIIPMTIGSLTTTLPISYIYVYIHTYMHIHYVLCKFICTLWHTWVFSYTHVYDYIVAHIYIYICIHVCIYIHTHICILIMYKCIVHVQDRHVQRCSPRHQLYKVLGMSADSSPRYHLNEVVPSGALPAVSGMKSELPHLHPIVPLPSWLWKVIPLPHSSKVYISE